MKRTKPIILVITLFVILSALAAVPAAALTEDEVQQQIAADLLPFSWRSGVQRRLQDPVQRRRARRASARRRQHLNLSRVDPHIPRQANLAQLHNRLSHLLRHAAPQEKIISLIGR